MKKIIFLFLLNVVGAVHADTATDYNCIKLGFDCYINKECVLNGAVKSSASTSIDYKDAMEDVSANPSHYVNWPNIYNVCH